MQRSTQPITSTAATKFVLQALCEIHKIKLLTAVAVGKYQVCVVVYLP